MKKKTILKEATVRRFWKLANVGAINEMGYQFGDELNEEEEEIEEVAAKDKDKEEVDEMMKGRRDDDEVDEMMKGRREDDEVDEMMKGVRDDEEVDEMMKGVRDDEADDKVDEMGDPAGMRDDAEAMDADEPAIDAPGDDDVDAEVSVPESDVEALRTARDVIDQILSAADGGDEPMGDDDPMDDEEPMMEEEELDEDKLEEMVSAIADRVKARLVKEALLNRVKK